MPVMIPTLKRIDPQEDQTVGRLQTNVPDVRNDGGLLNQTNKLLNTAHDYAWHVEDQAMDTAAIKADTEYQRIHSQRLDEIKNYQGDPTEAYKKLDEDMAAERLRMVSDETISDRTRTIVKDRLDKRHSQLALSQGGQFSLQLHKYTLDTHEAAGELRIKRYSNSVAALEPGVKDTYKPLNDIISESMLENTNFAVKSGLAIPDENGDAWATTSDGTQYRVKLSPRAKLNQQKEVSKGLSEALDNVLKAGGPNAINKVAAIKDQYWDLLDTDAQQKISKQMETTGLKQLADEIAGTSKTSADVTKAVANLPPAQRVEVEQLALQRMNDIQKAKDYRTERFQKQNMDIAANQVLKIMNGSKPFATPSDITDDPVIKNLWSTLRPEDKQKLLVMGEAPKVSNQKTLDKMNALLASGELKDLDPTQFEIESAGLNPHHKKFFTRQVQAFKNETDSQTFSRFKKGNEFVEEHLNSLGYIKKDDYGHYSQKDITKLRLARDQFNITLDAMGPTGPKELNDQAIKFATSLKTGETYSVPEKKKLQGTLTAKADSPKSSPTQVVKGKPRSQWAALYYKSHKNQWPDETELNSFIDGQD